MSNATTHTPARGRHAPAAELIAAADLPDPVAQRIATIVRSTRLWKSEQSDIARELIAHAHDALAAGRTPEEIAKTLGDPANVAPLLRRSARRKRPWHWHARHRALQGVGVALLALIGVYAVLFIRFNTGSPTITHNYLAELNERNSAHTEDQRALDAFDALYRAWLPKVQHLYQADAEYRADNEITERTQITAFEHYPYPPSDAPLYDRLLDAHTEVRPQLDAAIAASRRPALGMLYSDRHEKVTAEDGNEYFKTLPPSDDPRLAGPIVEVLLPALSQARSLSQLMALDAVLAARANDPDRAAESFTAVFDTARLVGQEHTLVSSLAAAAIQTMGESVLLRILRDHPDLFTDSHLTGLAHAASRSGRHARDLDLVTERRIFADFLQRAYTDDGRGDGRLTIQGLELVERMASPNANRATLEPGHGIDPAARFTGPIAMLAQGSRRDQQTMHDRLIAHAEAALRHDPADPAQVAIRHDLRHLIEELQTNPRYWMVAMIAPALDQAVETAHRSKAHTDATLTAIALHAYRHRTGRWPHALAELAPDLLPAVPEDPFDPGQPIKYRLIDGTPHLYFVGADAVDNHAARPPADNLRAVESLRQRYDPNPNDAPAVTGFDWVIFPPAD